MLPSYSTVSAGGPPGPPNTHLHGGNSYSHHSTASTAPYHAPSSFYGTSIQARRTPHDMVGHPEHQETSRQHNASSGCAATSQRIVDARFTNEDQIGSKTLLLSTYQPKRQSSTTVLDQSHLKIKKSTTTFAKEE
jgi:hypothetical protein